MKRGYTVVVLLLVICSLTVAGFVVDRKTILSKLGIISVVEFVGVNTDAVIEAQIADLSKQMETLQNMVTLLLPQQQEKIQQLQEQQNKQQLEDQRRQQELKEKEQQEKLKEQEIQRKKEQELKEQSLKEKQLQEQKHLKEQQLREELENKKLLEKKQRLLEQKLKEEQQIKVDEEAKKGKHEKYKDLTKEETMKQDVEETENKIVDEKGICEKDDDICTTESEEKYSEEESKPIQKFNGGGDETKFKDEEYQKLLADLETEKRKLKSEMREWQTYKSSTLRSQRRQRVERMLEEAKETEETSTQQEEYIEKLNKQIKEVTDDNAILRQKISLLEQQYGGKFKQLFTELEELSSKFTTLQYTLNEDKSPAVTTATVREIVNKALHLYDADRVGMPDYALESTGAVVFTIGETEPYTKDTPWMGVFGIPIWKSCKTPRLAIQMDNSAGNCWSFAGNKGTLTIQLAAQVFPEYFTMDHISPSLAPNGNASSAPYHFRVLGLDYGNAPKGHVLGNYHFTQLPIQTFAVEQNPYEKYFRFIKLEILSNHGNKDYTCLYRFRVHGNPYDTKTYNG